MSEFLNPDIHFTGTAAALHVDHVLRLTLMEVVARATMLPGTILHLSYQYKNHIQTFSVRFYTI